MSVATSLSDYRNLAAAGFKVAKTIAPPIIEQFGGGDTGGVATYFKEGVAVNESVQQVIEKPDPHTLHRYYSISLEKAMRGARLRAMNSYVAMRDVALAQYGGAFHLVFDDTLWSSFSGFTEKKDIAFNALYNRYARNINDEMVKTIFKAHGEIAAELSALYQDMAAATKHLYPEV